MNNIQRTSDLVKQVLTEEEITRNNDMILYAKVCERLNPNVLTMPFQNVICDLKTHKLPNFETVRRTRQKLQADFPELASNERISALRAKREEDFREYARGMQYENV